MNHRLIALAATLGIASLAAASLAGAAVPSVNGASIGGGMHGAGGGGGDSRGGGGYAGGHFGGGTAAASRFGGGHATGSRAGAAARFSGGGYRGGGAYAGRAGYAAHASFMAHGGYVAHGRSGYRIVGYESAAPARFGAMPRAGHGARMVLALGPRLGSAAAATRMSGTERVDRVHPRPGHPYCPPGHPKHPHAPVIRAAEAYVVESSYTPMFCENVTFMPPGKRPYSGCLIPLKAKVSKAR